MTDLHALRKAAEGKYELDDGDRWEIGQAADEIERLRSELAEYRRMRAPYREAEASE